MKRARIVCFIVLFWVSNGYARDFIVEFVEENYKETQGQYSHNPLIYHSIQVNSNVGPKVLILQGNDDQYRNWLRNYIAQDKKFIAKINTDRVDEFISSTAFKMEVSSLHPFDGSSWDKNSDRTSTELDIQGTNNILIVDPNETRAHLAQTVIEKMGYGVITFSSGRAALDIFELHPEKFKMVIVNYKITDMPPEDLADHIIKTNHMMPLVIDIGYNEPQIKDRFKTRFSGFRSVHLKSVILRELSKTVSNLMKKSA